jgi:hypothetical protein
LKAIIFQIYYLPMTRQALLQIHNSFKSFCRSFAFLQEKLSNYFLAIISHFAEIKHKLNHLSQSNIENALFHLSNGDYFDAYIRLKFITSFFDKNNTYANYLLGWTYFIREQYPQAIAALSLATEEDEINLLEFIQNIENANFIPEQIQRVTRNFYAFHFEEIFCHNYNIAIDIVTALEKFTPIAKRKNHILEIGGNISMLTKELIELPNQINDLEVIENSENMMFFLQKNLGQKAEYCHIHNMAANNYLAITPKKYDFILSLEAVDYQKNFSELLNKLSNSLADKSYLAFGLFTTQENKKFYSKLGKFIYNHYKIMQDLEKQFYLLHFIEMKISKTLNYHFYICNKKPSIK